MERGDNVTPLSSRQRPVRYTAHFDHHFDGTVDVCFEGVGESPSLRSKEALLAALLAAVDVVRGAVERHREREAEGG